MRLLLLCCLALAACTTLPLPRIQEAAHLPFERLAPASAPTCSDGICWSRGQCDSAEDSYAAWGGIAAGAAAVAGGGALSTAFPDSQGTRIALGVSSAVVAIASAVAVFERDRAAQNLTAHCALGGR